MANPETTTPAVNVLVTPKECRDQFRQLDSVEDPLLTRYITVATSYLEIWLRRSLITRTLTYRLDRWPSDLVIRIPRPPLLAINSVKYLDIDGVEQTLVAGTDYQSDAFSEPGRLRPAADTSWPAVQAGTYNTVRIEYDAGFGPLASDVPQEFRMMVLWVVAVWYRNREPDAPIDLKSVPHTLEDHISQQGFARVEPILGVDAENVLA